MSRILPTRVEEALDKLAAGIEPQQRVAVTRAPFDARDRDAEHIRNL
jgi:hypothetical protein